MLSKYCISPSLQPSNILNSIPSNNFKLFQLILMILFIQEMTCIDPQLKLQSGTFTIYNNPSNPTLINQYFDVTFATPYITAPICMTWFNQQTGQYNATNTNNDALYIRLDLHSTATDKIQLFFNYGSSQGSVLAKLLIVKYICFVNYYSNVEFIEKSIFHNEPIGTSGIRTVTESYTFPSSFTLSTDLERNILVYNLRILYVFDASNGYDFFLNIQAENLTNFKAQVTFTTTARLNYFFFYCYVFNLDGFPSDDPLISFEKIELTASFTQFNYDYVNGSDYVFLNIGRQKSDATDFDIKFEDNPSGGTVDFTNDGYDSLTIGVLIFASDAQDRVNKFVNKHCSTKDANFVCTTCNIGYELDSNIVCISTITNCKTNQVANHLLCDVCNAGYTLSTDQLYCNSNVANCDLMRSSTRCQKCFVGHDLSSDNLTCSPSIKDCVTMIPASATQCQICDTGYLLSSDQLLCNPNVTNCDVMQSALLCQSCLIGSTLSIDQLTCTINVDNCLKMQSVTECETCLSNYVLLVNNTFCVLSIENCKLISAANFTECEKCNDGFILTANQKCQTEGITVTDVAVGTSIVVIIIIAVVVIKSIFCVAVAAKGVFSEDFKRKRKDFLKRQQLEIRRLAVEQNMSIQEVESEKKQLIKKNYNSYQNSLGSY